MPNTKESTPNVVTPTPLPWGMVYGTDGRHHIFCESGPIAIVNVRENADEQQANADLFLAAPKLYAVLVRCAELLDDYSDITRDGRANEAMRLLPDVTAVLDLIDGGVR